MASDPNWTLWDTCLCGHTRKTHIIDGEEGCCREGGISNACFCRGFRPKPLVDGQVDYMVMTRAAGIGTGWRRFKRLGAPDVRTAVGVAWGRKYFDPGEAANRHRDGSRGQPYFLSGLPIECCAVPFDQLGSD